MKTSIQLVGSAAHLTGPTRKAVTRAKRILDGTRLDRHGANVFGTTIRYSRSEGHWYSFFTLYADINLDWSVERLQHRLKAAHIG